MVIRVVAVMSTRPRDRESWALVDTYVYVDTWSFLLWALQEAIPSIPLLGM